MKKEEARPPIAPPPGTRQIGFAELAIELARDPRGYAVLTGVERGPAGLVGHGSGGYHRSPGGSGDEGSSFSFCLGGKTYTAFEDPEDDYRSSMAWLVERPGNFCALAFPPCALLPRFSRREEGMSTAELPPQAYVDDGTCDYLELLEPSSGRAALSVGTSHDDSYYPSFVASHDPELLDKARLLGIGIAYELEADPALEARPAAKKRRSSI